MAAAPWPHEHGGNDVVERDGGCRILLVEDELRLRQTLTRSLAGRDFQVVEAATAAAAIAAAADCDFDVVLLDVNLPDATGWDVMRELCRACWDVPVVILSAAPPNPARVREFRPFGILYKPFPIDALLRLIHRARAGSTPVAGSVPGD